MKLDVTMDAALFASWLDEADLEDVYATLDYARLWAPAEHARAVGLRGVDDAGSVFYPLLRVPLDPLPGGKGRFDLRTPYDFGGPLVTGPSPALALKAFEAEFAALASDWGAVTHFARLHPFRDGPRLQTSVCHAENYEIDLGAGADAVRAACHASFRRNLRHSERCGVHARVLDDPDDAACARFVALYQETMLRVGADHDYFFAPELLRTLLALPEMLLLEARHDDTTLASACFLRSDRDLFYFLGASSDVGRELRPNHALFDAAIAWAAEAGLCRLHLGAGSPGLRRFKAQMASGRVPYHVVRDVLDPSAYQMLCAKSGVDPEATVFPAYRPALLARLDRTLRS